MIHPNNTLGDQIEQLVRAHIEASRQAAAHAIERAFSAAPSRVQSKPRRQAERRVQVHRRAPAEVAALGERLYEAVCAQPGETMGVLAPQLGSTPRELHRPMSMLKRAGRVRSVGQRQHMRYFPAVARPAANVS